MGRADRRGSAPGGGAESEGITDPRCNLRFSDSCHQVPTQNLVPLFLSLGWLGETHVASPKLVFQDLLSPPSSIPYSPSKQSAPRSLISVQLLLGLGWMERPLLSVCLWVLSGWQPLAGLSLAQSPVPVEQSLEMASRRDLGFVNRCRNPLVKVASESGHKAGSCG